MCSSAQKKKSILDQITVKSHFNMRKMLERKVNERQCINFANIMLVQCIVVLIVLLIIIKGRTVYHTCLYPARRAGHVYHYLCL